MRRSCVTVEIARTSQPFALMSTGIIFWVTTTASTLKLKSEMSRITSILAAHGVAYTEVL